MSVLTCLSLPNQYLGEGTVGAMLYDPQQHFVPPSFDNAPLHQE
jgi:hypothetical protein